MTIEQVLRAFRELEELEDGGVRLPYSPAFIVGQEAQGRIVDLESGEINIIPGDRARYAPTKEASNGMV